MKILKFSAIWCIDCIVMRPMWEEVEKKFPELEVENIDADESPERLEYYNIKDIPTFIFFDNKGSEILRLKGMQNKDELINSISEQLLK